ncbi:hypothetical protein HDC36_004138 [Xanthomonas sp. JAI131]|jgi:hypothetical protein|nr:hypothetical protein [Xanthomonas sp. JAI131]
MPASATVGCVQRDGSEATVASRYGVRITLRQSCSFLSKIA